MRWRDAGGTNSSVRMLCSRSASLISSTRTSSAIASSSLRRFSACLASRETSSSRFSLVRPSTSAPISWPEHVVDLGAGGLGVLDGVVQQRRDDGGIVELETGQDGRDLKRMGEIGIARRPCLFAMRFHGIDIGSVQQILVCVGIVGANAFDKVVLTHHRGRGGLTGAPRHVGAAATESVAACICRASAGPTRHRIKCLHARGTPPFTRPVSILDSSRPKQSNVRISKAYQILAIRQSAHESVKLGNKRKSPDQGPGLCKPYCRSMSTIIRPLRAVPRGGASPSRPFSSSSSVMRSTATSVSSASTLAPAEPIRGTVSGSGSSTSTNFCKE